MKRSKSNIGESIYLTSHMTAKPVYQVGEILVLRASDGRSINYSFLEVASFTKTGAPRVYFLEVLSEQLHCDGTCVRSRLTPQLTSRRPGLPQSMRWNPKRHTFAFVPSHGYPFTELELYDSAKVYESEWFRG
jgi:hypothetical protein